MTYVFALNIEQVGIILKHLDVGSHKEVRPLIDQIIAEVQTQRQQAEQQQVAAQQNAENNLPRNPDDDVEQLPAHG